MLYNGGLRLGLKISTTCNVSIRISLYLCFELSIRAPFLIRTGDCNIQKGEIISKNYIYFDDLKIVGVKRTKRIVMKKNLVKI